MNKQTKPQTTPPQDRKTSNQPTKTEHPPHPNLLLFSVQPWSACQEVPIYCTVSMVRHSCKDHISLYKHPLWWMNFNWTLELDSWSCTDQLLELGVFQQKPCKKPSLYGFHNNLESKSCVLLKTPEYRSNKDIIIHLIMTERVNSLWTYSKDSCDCLTRLPSPEQSSWSHRKISEKACLNCSLKEQLRMGNVCVSHQASKNLCTETVLRGRAALLFMKISVCMWNHQCGHLESFCWDTDEGAKNELMPKAFEGSEAAGKDQPSLFSLNSSVTSVLSLSSPEWRNWSAHRTHSAMLWWHLCLDKQAAPAARIPKGISPLLPLQGSACVSVGAMPFSWAQPSGC